LLVVITKEEAERDGQAKVEKKKVIATQILRLALQRTPRLKQLLIYAN